MSVLSRTVTAGALALGCGNAFAFQLSSPGIGPRAIGKPTLIGKYGRKK
ncbi:MAG TPA: hypothetical protein PKD87_11040 [Burkholderiaceae bacterium]|nr:hypothetical protein [Burkholderiaceae bacterium]